MMILVIVALCCVFPSSSGARIENSWTLWSSYSECSQTCGNGQSYRSRRCAASDGSNAPSLSECPDPSNAGAFQSQACNLGPCDLIREPRMCALWEEYCYQPVIKKHCPLTCGLPRQVHDIICPRLTFNQPGVMTCSKKFLSNSRCSFKCNSGFKLTGDRSVRCIRRGRWIGRMPECELIVCRNRGLVASGTVTCTKVNNVGSNCESTCDEGFVLNGTTLSTCLSTGYWDKSLPICTKIMCPLRGGIIDGTVVCTDGLQIGSECTIECDVGYQLVGAASSACLSSGHWSRNLSSCQKTPTVIDTTTLLAERWTVIETTHMSTEPSTVIDTTILSTVARTSVKSTERTIGAVTLKEPTGKSTEPPTVIDTTTLSAEQSTVIETTDMSTEGRTSVKTAEKTSEPSTVIDTTILSTEARASVKSTRRTIGPLTLNEPNGKSTEPPTVIDTTTLSAEQSTVIETTDMSTEPSTVIDTTILSTEARTSVKSTERTIGAATLNEPAGKPTEPPTVIDTTTLLADLPTIIETTDMSTEARTSVISTDRTIGAATLNEPAAKPTEPPTVIDTTTLLAEIHCAVRDIILNGAVSCTTGTDVDSECTSICDEGFVINGTSISTCLSTGHWDKSLPTCTKIVCPSRGDTLHGTLVCTDGSQIGSECTVKCSVGYKLVGVALSACLPTGHWNRNLPSCQQKTCSNPGPLNDGAVRPNRQEYTVGEMISFTCNMGYKIQGNNVATCKENERWSETLPTCKIATCKNPGKLVNGYILPNNPNYAEEQSIRYICNHGYRLNGHETAECEDGIFNRAQPRCEKIICPTPEKPKFGGFEPYKQRYGIDEFIIYECTSGYELHGDEKSQCLSTGLFASQAPLCIRRQCNYPLELDNGSVFPRRLLYDIGDTIEFRCNTGYRIFGSDSATCQNNGTFSAEAPNCRRIVCKYPGVSKNGGTTPLKDQYYLGDIVSYQCRDGFHLDGSNSAACLITGEFSAQPPKCKERCNFTTIEDGISGKIESPNYPRNYHNKACYVWNITVQERMVILVELDRPFDLEDNDKCSYDSLTFEGYGKYCGDSFTNFQTKTNSLNVHFESDSSVTGGGFSISWRAIGIFCSRLNFNQPGVMTCSRNFFYTSRCSFKCDSGFVLTGGRSVQCGHSGKWMGKMPACKRIVCRNRGRVASGIIMCTNDNNVGSNCVSTCDEGFVLSGTSISTCLSTGLWDESLPICTKIMCPTRDGILDGTVICTDGSQIGSECTVECNVGYKLVGVALSACLSKGNWNRNLPSCQQIICPTPEKPKFGGFKPYKQRYGIDEFIIYECTSGYELRGDEKSKCLSTGLFASQAPLCIRRQCKYSLELDNGSVFPRRLLYDIGDTIKFRCNAGYRIFGSDSATCQNNGTFSTDVPNCRRIVCKYPGVSNNGETTPFKGQYYLGDIVRYQCRDGFHLDGSNSATCLTTGEFSSRPPKCKERCNSTTIEDGISGKIESPNYPRNYHNKACYVWNITVPERLVILVELDRTFDLEDNDKCSYDSLTFEGYGKYCGDSFTNFQTNTNSLNVDFESDSSVTGGGFSISWRAIGAVPLNEPTGKSTEPAIVIDTTTQSAEPSTVMVTTILSTETSAVIETTDVSTEARTSVKSTEGTTEPPTAIDTTTLSAEQSTVIETTEMSTGASTLNEPDGKPTEPPTVIDTTTLSADLSTIIETTEMSTEPSTVIVTTIMSTETSAVIETTDMSAEARTSVKSTEGTTGGLTLNEPTGKSTEPPTAIDTTALSAEQSTVIETTDMSTDESKLSKPTEKATEPSTVIDTTIMSTEARTSLKSTERTIGAATLNEPAGKSTGPPTVIDTTTLSAEQSTVIETTDMSTEPSTVIDTTIMSTETRISVTSTERTIGAATLNELDGKPTEPPTVIDTTTLSAEPSKVMVTTILSTETSAVIEATDMSTEAGTSVKSTEETAEAATLNQPTGKSTEPPTIIDTTILSREPPTLIETTDTSTGKWSDWLASSSCTVTCGGGQKIRFRRCLGPGVCSGDSRLPVACNVKPCPGIWGDWSTWTKCTRLCNSEEVKRTRICLIPGNCVGETTQVKECNAEICAGKWSVWLASSSCNVTCGGGQKIRFRRCLGPGVCSGDSRLPVACNVKPCPDIWGYWSVWTKCTATCDGGKMRRLRICIGSGNCVGKAKEFKSCNTKACPVDEKEEQTFCPIYKRLCHHQGVRKVCPLSCKVQRDCQWRKFGPFGLCRNVSNDPDNAGVFTLAKRRERKEKPARYGGADCVGKKFDYSACSVESYAAGTFIRTIYSALTRRPGTTTKRCVKDIHDENGKVIMSGRKCQPERNKRQVPDYPDFIERRTKRELALYHRDVLFILDESSSVGPTNFLNLTFLADILMTKFNEMENAGTALGILNNGNNSDSKSLEDALNIRVGVLSFDSEIHVQRNFSKYHEESDQYIYKFHRKSSSRTCLGNALKYAKNNMFTSEDRLGLVLLFTDGCANCATGELNQIAKDLSDKGVPIITYLIAKWEDKCFTSMQDLAGGTECYQLFRSDDWRAFNETFIPEVEKRSLELEVMGTEECPE